MARKIRIFLQYRDVHVERLKDRVQTYFDLLMGNDVFEWMHSHVTKWKIDSIFGGMILQQVF